MSRFLLSLSMIALLLTLSCGTALRGAEEGVRYPVQLSNKSHFDLTRVYFHAPGEFYKDTPPVAENIAAGQSREYVSGGEALHITVVRETSRGGRLHAYTTVEAVDLRAVSGVDYLDDSFRFWPRDGAASRAPATAKASQAER